jgi:tetratricopeptide (TPR) repeat protein
MVKEALEKSELLAAYDLLRKGVAELDRVLEIYPDEIEIHKRLVGMCWKDMPERAEEAAQALVRIYTEQGDTESAKRFAQMAGGRKAPALVLVPLRTVSARAVNPAPSPPLPAQPAASVAGVADPAMELSLASDPSIPPAGKARPPVPLELPADLATQMSSVSPPGPSSDIQEIDLSEDWESFLAQTATSSPAPEAPQEAASFDYDDSRIEVNFYLEHGLVEEARKAVEELERTLPGEARIAELRALVEAHTDALPVEVPEKQPAVQAKDS